jgi:uncharacterized membrane protein
MDDKPSAIPSPPDGRDLQAGAGRSRLGRVWHHISNRILNGLLLVLPFLITFWIVAWLYSVLEKNIIDPLAKLVLWKLKWTTSSTELPYWFETFAGPVIALMLALALLYCFDSFLGSRLRWTMAWVLRRAPVVSQIYSPIQKMFQALEKQPGQQGPRRLVLIKFPHPGLKLPAFVTAQCRDIETNKVLLCVYVPTTPVPTSGFFLLVPEEEVTELNWSPDQTLQAIISGGLATPPMVSYFSTRPPTDRATSEVPERPHGGGSSRPV